MDINGTRFHLIKSQADWERCLVQGGSEAARLRRDPTTGDLTLRPLLSLFPSGAGHVPLDPSARRGAAADRFGNRYWIAADRQRLFWQSSGTKRPSVYWAQVYPPATAAAGEFGPVPTQVPAAAGLGAATLAGLAVTENHYLVAGSASGSGVLVFDLHAGGQPLALPMPSGAAFTPFDAAAAPGGGVWFLDRVNRTYWGLDRNFRLVVDPTASVPAPAPADTAGVFHPTGEPVAVRPAPQPAKGFTVAAAAPIAIEALPDGSVLILDLGVPPAASTLYHYRYGQLVSAPMKLEADVEVATAGTATVISHLALSAHDIAYSASEDALYVADRNGKQVVMMVLGFRPGQPLLGPVQVSRDYLPLHFFGGRGLLSGDTQVLYDVTAGDASRDTAVRWVALRAIDDAHYDRAAILETPPLDGKIQGCTWDRLLIDACIPQDAAVAVYTRAADDPDLLMSAAFNREPDLYLRGGGAELPYYNPYPEATSRPDYTGTWELLLQRAQGRWLQLRLELTGNGRVTPELRALRAYYGRHSYPRRYLPAVYRDDAESADFLERLLANPQGFYTDIEGKINDVSVLFDPRSAPPEALDWLAYWIGLVLDPLWARIQDRRRRPGDPSADRRRLFIRYAMRLYDSRGTPEGIQFALHLLLDPCLEVKLRRLKDAAVRDDPALRGELARLGLAYPTPTSSEEDFEALLFDYVMAPARPAKVRLVERFRARAGRAVVAGDPSGGQSEDTIQASAHRFSVLVPEDLPPEDAAMVERIVTLEKPAHTSFDVRRYWDLYRVGEARLGIDTSLGDGGRFVPMVLGARTMVQTYLGEGYLAPAPPMDTQERLIADRDRLGGMPSL